MSCIIKIYGVSRTIDPLVLAKFEVHLQEAVAGVTELGLQPGCIYVHFVNCGLRPSSGRDVRMEVASLLAKPERKEEVLQRVVDQICQIFVLALDVFPVCEYFEVTLQTVGVNGIGVSAHWEKPAIGDQEKVSSDGEALGQPTPELVRGPVITGSMTDELPAGEDSAEEDFFESAVA